MTAFHIGPGAILEPQNSTIAPGKRPPTLLGPGETYTGKWVDIEGFANVTVWVNSDVGSAIDGLKVEFSADATMVDTSDEYTVAPNGASPFSASVVAKFYRVTYTNGSLQQTRFRLQVLTHAGATKSSTHKLGEVISGDRDTELVQSVQTGEDGLMQGVNHFGAGLSASIIRILGGNFGGDSLNSIRWNSSVTGDATVTVMNGVVTLSSNGNGKAVVWTKRNAIAIAGMSLRFQSGVAHGPVVPGGRGRWGVYDDDNGCFYETLGTDVWVVTRKDGIDTKVARDDWSALPNFSPFDIISKYRIEYGTDRLFFRAGERTLHDYHTDTTNPTWTANLRVPIRYEVETLSGSGNATLSVRGASFSIIGTLDTTRIGDITAELTEDTPIPVQGSLIIGQDNEGLLKTARLTRGRSLTTTIRDSMHESNAIVTPDGALKVGNVTNHVGGVFGKFALAERKWTTTVTNGGSLVVGNGDIQLHTNTTADGGIALTTVDVARFLPANYQTFYCDLRLTNVVNTDNVLRFGAWGNLFSTPTGLFFEYASEEWNLCRQVGGTITKTPQEEWDGLGAVGFVTDLMSHRFEIHYSPISVLWYFDGDLIHTFENSAITFADTMHLPIGISNQNESGEDTDYPVHIRAASIYSVGSGQVFPPRYTHKTDSGATLIQTGPGTFRGIICSRSSGGTSTVTVYDNTEASGTVIATIVIAKDDTFEIPFDVTFNNGLTVSHSASGVNTTTKWD